MITNIPATIKDVKVTAKGITVNLENVNFKGEQLTHIASLIGSAVLIDVQVPQMSFDEVDAEFVGEEEEFVEQLELVQGENEVSEGLPPGKYTLSFEGGEATLTDSEGNEIEGVVETFGEAEATEEEATPIGAEAEVVGVDEAQGEDETAITEYVPQPLGLEPVSTEADDDVLNELMND